MAYVHSLPMRTRFKKITNKFIVKSLIVDLFARTENFFETNEESPTVGLDPN